MPFDQATWRAACADVHGALAAVELYFRAAAEADRTARGAVPPKKILLEQTVADVCRQLAVAFDRLSRPA